MADLFEIFFQFHYYTIKRSSFLSGLILNEPLNLINGVKKIPSLRIILSTIKIFAKKNFFLIIEGLIIFFLENPSLCSKSFIQEISWNVFRLNSNIKGYCKTILDIRTVSFLNGSWYSLFFFSFILKFFKLVYVQSFINFCFKNVENFISYKSGHCLLICIINYLYMNKKEELNFFFF